MIRHFKKPYKKSSISHCKAPFTSMYFRPDGSVTPCCFNTSYVYGKYPDNSIDEIWTGNSIKYFRDKIISGDLSLGCQVCKHHLTNNSIANAGFNCYSGFTSNPNYPVKLELELSHRCNLNCVMCFQPKGDYPTEDVYNQEFVNQLSDIFPYLQDLEFFGGEPFFIELYYKIWESISHINPSCFITVQTNGTIWNEAVQKTINKGNFRISVSLDAIDELLYESIRVKAKLNETIKNIYHYNDYMRIKSDNLLISVCPMKDNVYNIPEIIRFSTSLNADILFHTVSYPPAFSLLNLSKKEIQSILSYYSDFFKSYKEISEQNKNRFIALNNQIASYIDNQEKIERLLDLNKDYDDALIIIADFIKDYIQGDEKQAIINRLNSLFGRVIENVPVVYGINLITNNSNPAYLVKLIKTKTDKDLLDYFISMILLSI